MDGLPAWAVVALFLGAAAVVWWAGTRLGHHADAISARTGLGEALVGMLLLGGITSLPEIAVSVTAGATGNAELAVSNVLGGVAMQVVILVLADAMLRGAPVSGRIGRPVVMLQAVGSLILLVLIAAAVAVGDVAVFGVGAGSIAVLLVGLLLFWVIAKAGQRPGWRPALPAPDPARGLPQDSSLRRHVLGASAMGLLILCAGYVLSRSGELIAEQTGLGQAFTGAILVGTATSLPEISTVVAAVRLRRYAMAFGDIFGTNIFDLMLLAPVDLVSGGGAVLASQGRFALFGALLGALLTLLFLVGLLVRSERAPARLGWESWTVLATYAGGVAILYSLR